MPLERVVAMQRGSVRPSVDVLIVGSGIAGATYLRVIADAMPSARILMVEAGPRLTDVPGLNLKNIPDESIREKLQIASQGPAAFLTPERTHVDLARPGTFLVSTDDKAADFPAGAASCNVGGMGAHWTCACPSPEGTERIPFLPSSEMERLLLQASRLLQVNSDLFAPSNANLDVLQRIQSAAVTARRPVSQMPLACSMLNPRGGRTWSGPNTILGSWAEHLSDNLTPHTLLDRTLAVRIHYEGRRALGADLRDLATGREFRVDASSVVIAADSLRSPQLLWNSGIRPPALGRFLNEHPQILSAVSYTPPMDSPKKPDVGVFWIPFDDTVHPFHGQVMPLSVSPIPISHQNLSTDSEIPIALSWFCRKDIRSVDRVTFSDGVFDAFGLPAIHIDYGYSDTDNQRLEAARTMVRRVASSLGPFLPGEEPRLLPAGRSLHYQGTLRMSSDDDGDSVCDAVCCVWGFDNLFVAGNGVIPTATACNPTLTSAALAILGAEHLVSLLLGSRT